MFLPCTFYRTISNFLFYYTRQFSFKVFLLHTSPAHSSTVFVFSSRIILNLIFIQQVPFNTTVFVYDFSPFVTKFPLRIFLLLDALFYVTEFIFLYLYEHSAKKDTLYAPLLPP